MARPLRGEVWVVDLGLAQKTRPAVVISREYGDNDRALITVVPHTTTLRNSEFEVRVEVAFLAKPGAFMTQGVISVPSVYATRWLGSLNPEQIAKVEEKVRLWLGL
jgi:mRNA interferase MazF